MDSDQPSYTPKGMPVRAGSGAGMTVLAMLMGLASYRPSPTLTGFAIKVPVTV